MNTITRPVVSREVVAPAYSRKWSRAMSHLNHADDQNYLVEVSASEDRAAATAKSAVLISECSAARYTQFTRLVTALTAVTDSPQQVHDLVLTMTTPNGPNSLPQTHLKNAVGPRSAA